MENLRTYQEPEARTKSLSHALSILNDSADESAKEIRGMINSDYLKLKKVFSETRPDVKGAFGEIKEVAAHTLIQAKDKVVDTTKTAAVKVDHSVHESPWAYLGGVALVSALTGFVLGRRNNRH
jgi:ElaB/YqjD/DUF883 family membrane-anchored ribosome-binding protein